MTSLFIKHPAHLKCRPHGISRCSKRVSYGLIGKPRVSKISGCIDVDLRTKVMFPMVCAGKHNKVFKSVIGFGAVDVMHFFGGSKSASDVSFHDDAVFLKSLAIDANDGVSSGIKALCDVLPGMLTGATAKMPSSVGRPPMWSFKGGPAGRANCFDVHIPIVRNMGCEIKRNGQAIP